MTRHEGFSDARLIKFKSLVLVLGLMLPVTATQGDSTSGDVIICNDNNVCTDDSVNHLKQCVYTNNSNPCDDNNTCTTNDRCSNGFCSGTALDCNDLNECTNDSCHPSGVCINVNNSIPCNDGVFCNGRDTCSGGACVLHSGTPCMPNVICYESTQSCGPVSVISFKAVKINNVVITPGTCNLALVPPKCSTGNVNKLCADDAECHVGTSNLIPNRCAGGININDRCSTNGDCPGSTCISIRANDIIEVEIFLSRWGSELPAGVRLFQLKLDRSRFVSSDNGSAKPLGWCGPVEMLPCTEPATCPSEYSVCLTDPPVGCTCSPHTPELGGFITTSRPDFLLSGLDGPYFVATSNIGFKYFALAENPAQAVIDTEVPRYLGTLILKVSANACGTFNIGSVQEITSTFIADPAPKANLSLPTLQPLTFTVNNCSRQLLSCNPGHCNIDARIAHDRLDQGTKKNAFQMTMTFSKSTVSPNMTAADFEVTVVPFAPDDVDDDVRTITAVTPDDADPTMTTLTFDRRIRQTRWTCIRDKGSNKRCCMGSLPPDSDNTRISQFDDVFELYDNLQGIVSPVLAVEKCDIDHSVRCSPADLLMAVDLLTGADAFDPTSGNSIPALFPACPTMNMPP